jgi:hypothetical protein
VKKAGAILVLALLAVPTVSEARDRGKYSSGSIRHRPGPPPRPHPRPPHRPPRPGVTDAYIRNEVRKEIRREIRQARRERALFLGGLAILGAVTRSLPPRHTTIVVQGSSYYYADGTWYVASGGQYRCVPPPLGAVVPVVPPNAYVIAWGGVRYQYFNGAFYAPRAGGYVIVSPPPGVIVPGLPDGYVLEGSSYQYGGIAYREVLGPDGEPGYQVVGQP